MATAQLQYRVNGGALHEDSIEVSAGDAISLTAADFSGWATARWEAVAKPPDVVSLTGWTYDSATQRFYYLANSGASGPVPPTITLPSDWGKWTFRLTVRDGSGTAIVSEDLSVSILSTNGLQDLAVGEKAQFGGARNWPGPFQDNLRVLDAWMTAGGPIAVADVPFVLDGVDPSGLLTSSVNGQALAATLALASTTVAPLAVRINPSTNSTIVDVFSLRRSTSHASHGANGLGARIFVELEDSAGNHDRAGAFEWDYTDATSTSEDARLTIKLQTAGSLEDALVLSATGVTLPALAGSGTRSVTADANGVLGTTTSSGGADATAHYVVDATTATNANDQPLRSLAAALAFNRAGGAPVTLGNTVATSGAKVQVLSLRRLTGGAGANNDGGYISFTIPDSGSSETEAARLGWSWQNVTGTYGSVSLAVRDNLGLTERYTWASNGKFSAVNLAATALSSAGLLTNDGSGNLVSNNSSILSVGTVTNVSNAKDITNLSSALVFQCNSALTMFVGRSDASTNTTIPVMQVARASATAGANDIGGSIDFLVADSGADDQTAARIAGRLSDATSTSHVGVLDFYTCTGGAAPTVNATLNGGGVWATVGAMKTDAGFDSTTPTALPIGASSTSLTLGSNATAAHVDTRLASAGSARWYVNNVLQASLGAASLTWGETLTTPVFGQDARTTDAATTTTVLAGQAPWASATGTNRNSGSVRARIPSPAAGGAEGFFYVEISGADVMRVGRPSGTFEAEVRFSTAATVIRPATISGSTLELYSAGVRLSGDTIRLQDVGQTPQLTWAVTSTAITATHAAGLATVTETWTQDASAAGGTWTWNGQRGASGFAGGSLAFNVGDGGTTGTNAPGNFDIGLGTAVSSVTGKARFLNAAAGVLGTIGQVAGPTFEVASGAVCTTGVSINATAGDVALKTNGTTRLLLEDDGSAATFSVDVVTNKRFASTPSTPTSTANAVTISLSDSQNPRHTVTEATTVTVSGGTVGQRGIIEFVQGASGFTVTMPDNGTGVEYEAGILALGASPHVLMVDATAFTRTTFDYYVLANGKALIRQRAVNTIP